AWADGGLVVFSKWLTCVFLGESSCRNSSRFGSRVTDKRVAHVTLRPGLFMLVTSPSWIGSPPVWKTIGIAEVAAFAARPGADVAHAAMTVTWRRTRSAASVGSRSYWPCAQRYSIATLRPSTKPVSFKPWRNAATLGATGSGDPRCRNPITGIAGC